MSIRRFSFVRHGRVNGPAALYGKTNIELSANGRRELSSCLEKLHQLDNFDFIISSPLKRCAGVAEDYANAIAIPIAFDPQLQEMDFGEWDGIDFNLLKSEWPQLEKFWQSPGQTTAQQGERLITFQSRVVNAWQRIKNQNNSHTLILCHGGTIRMIIAEILNTPLESALFQQLHIDYCSHTYIELGDHADAKPIIRWIGARI
jgi:alpha-ribazole phosphatase